MNDQAWTGPRKPDETEQPKGTFKKIKRRQRRERRRKTRQGLPITQDRKPRHYLD